MNRASKFPKKKCKPSISLQTSFMASGTIPYLIKCDSYLCATPNRYYASGRTLDSAQLKEVFSSMLQEARSMQGRYSGDIAEKSRQVNLSELLPLVRRQ